MLEAFSAPGRFWRGNLHGHSTMSDGKISPEDVVRRYHQAGYDFICLSDHFMERYGYPVTDTRPYRRNDFTTLLGAEVHAPATGQGDLWHLVAAGLPEDFAGLQPGEDGPALARRCAEAGAFVALAHPHWSELTLEDALSIDAADAVEIYNHKSANDVDRGDGTYLWDALLHAGKRPTAIASDDSHWNEADAFAGWVMVKAEANTPEALLAALKEGLNYSSQGPQIHDVRREGDELVIACSPAQAIILAGRLGWRRRVIGSGLTEARLPLEPGSGGFRRLTVRDAYGRRAWTNPLWFD